MASTSPQPAESTKPCDITNLMSPPEAPKIDSFGSTSNSNLAIVHSMTKSTGSVISEARRIQGPLPPLSPPISPATKLEDKPVIGAVGVSTPDPILYPTHDSTNVPPQQPLFGQEELATASRIVDDHILARPAQLFHDTAPPKKGDYELVLHFRSQMMKKYMENPRTWLQRERAQLIADRQALARSKQFRPARILPAKPPQPVRKEVQRSKPLRAPKITKPTIAKATPAKPRPIRAGPDPFVASAAAIAAIPLSAGLTKSMARAPSSTPDPSPRRTSTQSRADDDFNSVDDFCPPLDSIPSNMSSLKMEWKTGTTDLTNDPNRHLLHPEELTLASSLRLTAAVYLTSKRRIFVKRVECLRIGKEFRKTDAQQACKIDVNKASKLWTAFDKIGWLDKAWVAKYV
ncbi:SWIRM domain-containing protein [Xylaria palmicola]|nr:SWIRM domain-containing protein [Xylaria palmicola]